MKKFISILITVILVCTVFTGCVGHEGYNYSFNDYELSYLNGKTIEDSSVESAELYFSTGDKTITFICNGVTYNGELTQPYVQDGNDMWKVVWDTNPEGNENYTYNYSTFICSSDYDSPSPYVMLLMYFEGDKDSLEAFFSMKYVEVEGEEVTA